METYEYASIQGLLPAEHLSALLLEITSILCDFGWLDAQASNTERFATQRIDWNGEIAPGMRERYTRILQRLELPKIQIRWVVAVRRSCNHVLKAALTSIRCWRVLENVGRRAMGWQ